MSKFKQWLNTRTKIKCFTGTFYEKDLQEAYEAGAQTEKAWINIANQKPTVEDLPIVCMNAAEGILGFSHRDASFSTINFDELAIVKWMKVPKK